MAEIKNDFLKSRMNKDLDDRLVPKGEYRHAQNISVAKSEGNDVGAIENIIGNNLVSNFQLPADTYNVEIIGYSMDVRNDSVVVFMTNYVDASSDSLSNFSPADAYHAIGVYSIIDSVSSIVVSGRFLNFSKTHEIYGVNILDDLLFWTDNRNQPRKINLSKANPSNLTVPTYYTTEDSISVSKYYPYTTIDLITPTIYDVRLTDPGTAYGGLTLPANNLPTSTFSGSGLGTGLTVDITAVNVVTGEITGWNINSLGIGYQTGDVEVIQLIPGQVPIGAATLLISVENMSTMRDVTSDYLPDGFTSNPYRQPYGLGDITWQGDSEYLKDKFVKFSYRFKFDDGEYSLIAPFTQTCFIPKQDGYFIGDDDAKTWKSTEVGFMENKVNDIGLIINAPTGKWSNINNTMKVEEVDIIYKQAGQNAIKIVETITKDQLDLVNSSYLLYNYTSSKPWKTLPTSEILRVSDQVPVRALGQEVTNDRVVYGNYIDKPTPPATINYSCDIVEKAVDTQIEYQNQNLKQNRTYQVGVVLADRYGRQSTVILSSLDKSTSGPTVKGSTLFNKYKQSPFSEWALAQQEFLYTGSGPVPLLPGDIWDGDALQLTFWDIISSTKNSTTGEPGIYDAITNPLGWYSYKIVVKQTEQDYYNIYFPGILNGYIDGDARGTAATSDEPICHFVLQSDNINKVPRDLTLVGPNQNIFRTGRPSAQEDPSYYQFVDSSGIGFSVDPFSEEGERLLKERDRERDLDSGSQITNASVKVSLRLNNTIGATATDPTTQQFYPGTNLDVVTTIGTGTELGLWDASATPPFNTANVFYSFENNPLIAKIDVSSPTGNVGPSTLATQTGLDGPHPNSGRFNFKIIAIGGPGPSGYVAGSENISCNIPSSSGAGTGFKVNIDAVTSGYPTALSIADSGTGWDMLGAANPAPGILNCIISGAGDGTATFTLAYTKTDLSGNMKPSLAAYEIEPLKSKLNIYWETSTNGLITDLNTAVNVGDVTTPTSFIGSGGTPIVYNHNESMIWGTQITNPTIFPTNPAGNILAGPTVNTLVSVIDGYSADRVNEFTLVPVGDGFYLETNAVNQSIFVCNGDNNIRNTFTFNINVEAPSPTYLLDGTFINRQVALGPYTLANNAPTMLIIPAITYEVWPLFQETLGLTNTLLGTFRGENGTYGSAPSFLTIQGLTWTVLEAGNPVPGIYLTPGPNFITNGEMELRCDNSVPVGVYEMDITLYDGLMLSNTRSTQITVI